MKARGYILRIGYRTLTVGHGLHHAMRFLGLLLLQTWKFLVRPRKVQLYHFIEQFYLIGLQALPTVILFSIFLSGVLTTFSGLHLSAYGVTVQVTTLLNEILPRMVAPLIVNLILLFRAIHWLRSAHMRYRKKLNPSFMMAYLFAMPVSAMMLYTWFIGSSLLIGLLIGPLFGVSIERYFIEIKDKFMISNFIIGGIKTVFSAAILAATTLYYQYHHKADSFVTIMKMLSAGTIGLLLSQAIIQFMMDTIQKLTGS